MSTAAPITEIARAGARFARPLRIVQVNDLASGGAGAESHLFALFERQRDAGQHVELFACQRPLPSSRSPATWWSRRNAARMRELLERFDPDVVHVHNAAFLSPSVLAACGEHRAKLICTLHDFRHLSDQTLPGAPRTPRGVLSRWLDARKIRFVRSVLARHVDAFLCPSRALAERTTEWAPREKIHHLPYPIAAPESCSPPPANGSFLFAGRLESYKGLDTLRAALALCDDRVRVRIAGDGPMAEACSALPGCEWLGLLPRERIREELRACRALLVPSEWLENYPLSVLEAQAEGRAVIASTVGGLPEMVLDGVSGLLVPPFAPKSLADALTRLADDADLCARLGGGGRERVLRENDVAHFDAKLERFYREGRP